MDNALQNLYLKKIDYEILDAEKKKIESNIKTYVVLLEEANRKIEEKSIVVILILKIFKKDCYKLIVIGSGRFKNNHGLDQIKLIKTS